MLFTLELHSGTVRRMEIRAKVTAYCLLSGGLDSQLAVCVLKEQGIPICAITFESPFFGADAARCAAEQLEVPLQVLPFTEEALSLQQNPKHGFGSCQNPCIDCHALMLRRAGQWMEQHGGGFLATGEVLNERPMSQNRRSLGIVAAESGYGELVVRPLSARLLEETKPERLGWVDRERLLALEGRGRKTQIRLALQYGLKKYPSPSGGCRLSEPNYGRRLKDLKKNEGLSDLRAIERLRVGRHFRLSASVKAIVGRDETENALLAAGADPQEWVLSLETVPGPTVILSRSANEDQLRMAAAICARYSDCPKDCEIEVQVSSAQGRRGVRVLPLSSQEADQIKV